MSAQIYLPLAPLHSMAKRKSDVLGEGISYFSDKEFARMIGVSSRTVVRWRKANDQLSWQAADEAATALGTHPSYIWGDKWYALDSDIINGSASRQTELQISRAMDHIGRVLARESAMMANHDQYEPAQ